eukprot:Clim_evm97s225 gene=Clim_evmTU97s225
MAVKEEELDHVGLSDVHKLSIEQLSGKLKERIGQAESVDALEVSLDLSAFFQGNAGCDVALLRRDLDIFVQQCESVTELQDLVRRFRATFLASARYETECIFALQCYAWYSRARGALQQNLSQTVGTEQATPVDKILGVEQALKLFNQESKGRTYRRISSITAGILFSSIWGNLCRKKSPLVAEHKSTDHIVHMGPLLTWVELEGRKFNISNPAHPYASPDAKIGEEDSVGSVGVISVLNNQTLSLHLCLEIAEHLVNRIQYGINRNSAILDVLRFLTVLCAPELHTPMLPEQKRRLGLLILRGLDEYAMLTAGKSMPKGNELTNALYMLLNSLPSDVGGSSVNTQTDLSQNLRIIGGNLSDSIAAQDLMGHAKYLEVYSTWARGSEHNANLELVRVSLAPTAFRVIDADQVVPGGANRMNSTAADAAVVAQGAVEVEAFRAHVMTLAQTLDGSHGEMPKETVSDFLKFLNRYALYPMKGPGSHQQTDERTERAMAKGKGKASMSNAVANDLGEECAQPEDILDSAFIIDRQEGDTRFLIRNRRVLQRVLAQVGIQVLKKTVSSYTLGLLWQNGLVNDEPSRTQTQLMPRSCRSAAAPSQCVRSILAQQSSSDDKGQMNGVDKTWEGLFLCVTCIGDAEVFNPICEQCAIHCHSFYGHELRPMWRKSVPSCACGSALFPSCCRLFDEDLETKAPATAPKRYIFTLPNRWCYEGDCKFANRREPPMEMELELEDVAEPLPFTSDLMWQCATCENWFHPPCCFTSLVEIQEQDPDTYICNDCYDDNQEAEAADGDGMSTDVATKVEGMSTDVATKLEPETSMMAGTSSSAPTGSSMSGPIPSTGPSGGTSTSTIEINGAAAGSGTYGASEEPSAKKARIGEEME